MARITFVLLLLAVSHVPGNIESHAADNDAAKSADELALMPRDTVIVVRIASAEKLAHGRKEVVRSLSKSLLAYVPAAMHERLKESAHELEELVPTFGVLEVGDPDWPQYLGMVALPRPAGEVAAGNDEQSGVVAEFGMVHSDIPGEVQEILNALDRKRYEQELEKYEELKSQPFVFVEMLAKPDKPRKYHCLEHNDWVLFSSDQRCLPLLNGTIQEPNHSLAEALDQSARDTLLAGKVSAAVNMQIVLSQPEVVAAFEDIKLEYEKSLLLIDQWGIEWKQWGLSAEQVKESLQQVLDSVFALREEPCWLAGNLDFSSEAFIGAGVPTVKPAGRIDQFLKARPASELGLLEKLPQGMPAYLAYRSDNVLRRLQLSLYEKFAATVKERLEVRALKKLVNSNPRSPSTSQCGLSGGCACCKWSRRRSPPPWWITNG